MYNRIAPLFTPIALVLIMMEANADELQRDAVVYDPISNAALVHVRTCLENVQSIRAEFVQESFHRLHKRATDTKRGVIEIRRGGRFRLEYTQPSNRLVVSDGITLSAFNKKRKLAIQSRADDEMLKGVFQLFVGDFDDASFFSRHLGGSQDLAQGPMAVELVPFKEDSLIASLVITIVGDFPCIQRILVVDQSGTVIRFKLENADKNRKISEERFVFKPPAGTKVVRP